MASHADRFEIPADKLPAGFAERIEHPPRQPVVPAPAATAVLLRQGEAGPEALLLRRNRSSGFVPGAYVFPGGRVDDADTDPRLLDRVDGLAPDAEPEPAFWLAAAREVFEETAVLLADGRETREPPSGAGADTGAGGSAVDGDAADQAAADLVREALLADEITLLDALEHLDARLALDGMVYLAHWVTPEAERRRYDTRFFLAKLPDGAEVSIDAREMTDAVWLTPETALARFRAGDLPMVFPTVKTLESLTGHDTVATVLAAHRDSAVAPILPRLVRTDAGVAIVVDDP